MILKELTTFLESAVPLAYQESYDNCGLIVGDPNMEIKGILLCLDSTEAVVEEALQKGCNVVLAHHPILFSGLKRLTGSNYIERTLLKAIKHDVAIYAMHTNLDHVQAGVNAKIAEKLGLRNTRILAPKRGINRKLVTFVPHGDAEKVRQAIFKAGAGHIGNYSETSYNLQGLGTFKAEAGANPTIGEIGERHQEPETRIDTIFPAHLERQVIQALIAAHPYEEAAYDIVPLENEEKTVGAGMIGDLAVPADETAFLQTIKESMRAKVLRYTPLRGKPIHKVAVCGGSGSFLLKDAIRAGADIFITADLKYHQFFDAEGRIMIADIGHYESEQFTPEIFHSILTEKFRNFVVIFSEINTNPINYF
ncbi:MAG: Nif3-like dinuclear metal center hexameric protein [Chitinophagales bacterium]|nr:Nif3-like dinuclear metal center hexameric protein [Chitinophagales bacterium]